MFSVIIPLYNKEHTVVNTIQSVLNQTLDGFEIIVVDDGSTDYGVDLIKKSIKDQRISIISQQNQGVSVARNNGLYCAKYEYVAFLDGDDEWLPNYLATMKGAIEQFPNAGLYCCAGKQRNSNGFESLRIAEKYKNQILEINFFENPHVFLHTSATVVSKSKFKSVGGFPVGMKRNEDFALFFLLALEGPVVYCGIPLSIYVGGIGGQATSENSNLHLCDIAKRHNLTHEKWLENKKENKLFLTFQKYELRHAFITFLRQKDYQNLALFVSKLNSSVLTIFSRTEKLLIKKKQYNKIAIGFILLTKIYWRTKGFPRV